MRCAPRGTRDGSNMAAEEPKGPRLLIVGVGASAGGLEALQQLLAQVPAGLGVAFVVMFHLDPTAPALFGDLLPQATRMPIVTAADGTAIEADHVYTVPGHMFAALEKGALRLF